MKTISAELQTSTPTNVYDKTKTYIGGRATQSTVDGQLVTSPALTKLYDIQTQYAVGPGQMSYNHLTGRLFVLSNTNSNTPTILAFNLNSNTAAETYIGKIIMTLAPGVHALKGFDVDDTTSSNIKVFVSTTVTTALCSGGTFSTWSLDISDFTVGGTTIFPSTGSNQKAVYFHQYTGQLGLNNVATTSGGCCAGYSLSTLANKTKFFQQNGVAATPTIYGWDYSLGNPDVAGKITNGIDAQTTLYAGTSPSAFFRMGASLNGYSLTAPTAAAFESIILQNGTNNVPANFVSTTTGGAQTVYFIRDLQLVGGIYYFNLSLTSTGAAVTPTSNTTSFTMMRASGITSSHSLLKTGTLPAIAGTFLGVNSFGSKVPTSVPLNAGLDGQDCLYLATASTFVLGKVSDLVDGSGSWASKTDSNVIGTGIDITAPTPTIARYSDSLDRWVYVTNTSTFVIKRHQNNSIDRVFGGLTNTYLENQTPFPVTVQASLAAISGLEVGNGWLFMSGSTVGQRVVVACDIRSDELFDYSMVITKVLSCEPGSILKYLSTLESYFDFTDAMSFYIRSATTASDAVFNTAAGGWSPIYQAEDNSPINLGPFFQIKVLFNIATVGQNSPSQLNDLIINYIDNLEIDNDWVGWVGQSTQDGVSPAYSALKQIKSKTSAVAMRFTAIDEITKTVIVQKDTDTDFADFDKTSNSGTSWSAMTGANDYPNVANTSGIRYRWGGAIASNAIISWKVK